MDSIRYNDQAGRWTVRAGEDRVVTARYVVTAVGALSAANRPYFAGAEDFGGEQYSTASWPHEPVPLAGKRVGLIGTGSSGVQVLPQLARQARTSPYSSAPRSSLPPLARNGLIRSWSRCGRRSLPGDPAPDKFTAGGIPIPSPVRSALELSAAERLAVCEEAWRRGGIWFLDGTFSDTVTSLQANAIIADFVRSKIGADRLRPGRGGKAQAHDHAWGTKRVPIGSDYYETYNRPNVSLLDLRADRSSGSPRPGSAPPRASNRST